MQIIDEAIKTRGFQAMVEMRDGTRLNTFVFLPGSGGPRWPVLLHRTPRHHNGKHPRQDRRHKGMAARPRGTAARLDPARMAQDRRAS
jgi:predicted acyl esterase